MSGPVWKRPGTPPPRDRDEYTEKHAAPEFVDEPATGRIDITDEQRAEIRSKRGTDGRISSLERWRVVSEKQHLEVVGALGTVNGKLDAMSQFLGMKTEQDGKTQRTRITADRKALIAIVVAAITTIGTVLVAVLK